MFDLFLSGEARRFCTRADRPLAKKLAHAFRILEQDPRKHPNVKALSGVMAGHFRFRAGDYLIVYFVDEAAKAVHVIRIAHRSEAYR